MDNNIHFEILGKTSYFGYEQHYNEGNTLLFVYNPGCVSMFSVYHQESSGRACKGSVHLSQWRSAIVISFSPYWVFIHTFLAFLKVIWMENARVLDILRGYMDQNLLLISQLYTCCIHQNFCMCKPLILLSSSSPPLLAIAALWHLCSTMIYRMHNYLSIFIHYIQWSYLTGIFLFFSK